jgi:hypothetical protein
LRVNPPAVRSAENSCSLRSRPARMPIMIRSTILAGCGSLPGGMTASIASGREPPYHGDRDFAFPACQPEMSQKLHLLG